MAFMRIFWLVVLMVLLPLRGWTGDAMATRVASGQTTSAAQGAHPTQAATTHAAHAANDAHDCVGHAPETRNHPEGTCESCSACQACHTLALLVPAAGLTPLAAVRSRADAAADRFASADATPGHKPPIS